MNFTHNLFVNEMTVNDIVIYEMEQHALRNVTKIYFHLVTSGG